MSEAEDLGQMIKKAVKEVLHEDILPRLQNLEKQMIELTNIKQHWINIHNGWINMKQQWILTSK